MLNLNNLKMNHQLFVLLFILSISNFCLAQQDKNSIMNHLSSTRDSYCRIPMQDLISTAESTASRVLQGICNPRELNERFSNLEAQLRDQFNVLKTMVLNLEDKLRDQDEQVKGQHRKLFRILTMKGSRKGELKKNSNFPNKKSSRSSPSKEKAMYDYYEDAEDLNDEEFKEELPSVRSSEILKYNSTIHNVNGSRVFTYYWTVHDIVYRMKNWPWRRSLRSKSFYIFQFGYRMYMRIYPNQNGKNIYMHVGITQGAYDDSLEWPFKLKHKIQVLDHDTPGEDLFSRVWDPKELCSGWNWKKPDPLGDNYECVGLGFPQDTIYSRNYLHNNSITVKLTVFLDV
ncbi:UNVERIFIED_CONTAM: hypothetical protein RMT77_008046 [Armadillidium vulgare]